MKKHCRECGDAFSGSASASFCPDKPCRRTWNNRRQQRGAELYDLFMTIRGERSLTASLTSKGHNLWTMACQLAADWKYEDATRRGGRRSYQFIPDLIAAGKFTHLAAKIIGIDRTGRFSKPTTRKAAS